MKLRSMLFVPADSDRKLIKSLNSAADALIIDLEDSVAASRKAEARLMAPAFIAEHARDSRAAFFVRINPLDSGLAMDDLAAVVAPGLAGIMLPKTRGAHDIAQLSHCLDALEARAGMTQGSIGVVPVATETPQAMINLTGFSEPRKRLVGVTWGAEDLSAAVGALSNREEDGSYSPLYDYANSMCLVVAASAGVPAIDTLYADFKDVEGLAAACKNSRRRGFKGRIAIHPDQVDTINAAFSPSGEELGHARRIVDAFRANPDAGTLSIDGVMVDLPHLVQAQRTLEMA